MSPDFPRNFGAYVLLGELGSGAMGVVYQARHLHLNRPVALKLLRVRAPGSGSELRRFLAEAEAAAALEHPHIVPVYEVGEHEGQPFLSLKLIEGGSLAERVAGRPWRPEAAAKLLAKLALAVAHAHKRGVLHRDLKPGNVLLDQDDEPCLADFGLAKLRDSPSDLTASHAFLGTPAYMAPEVAVRGTKAATTAADIYSLGAVLYELLTGRPLFVGDSALAVLEQVKAGNFPAPRQANPGLPRDLELVCLKCLRPDPHQRYANAGEIAADCERFLRHEPVSAREVTVGERLLVWVRLHKLTAGLLAALLASMLLGLGFSLREWSRAERHLAASQAANRKLADTLARGEQEWAEPMLESKQPHPGLCVLARLLVENPSNHLARARLESALVQQRIAWPLLPPLRHSSIVIEGRFDPRGRWILTATRDDQVHVWDGWSGERLWSFPHRCAAGSIAISPNGEYLATSPSAGTVQVWSVGDYKVIHWWTNFVCGVTALKFSPATGSLAIADRSGHLEIREVLSGERRWQAEAGDTVDVLRFDWQGHRMLTAGPRHCSLWTLHSTERRSLAIPTNEPVALADFSRSTPRLLTVSGGQVQVWNTDTGQLLKDIQATAPIRFASFSANGYLLAAAAEFNRARVYETEAQEDRGRMLPHDKPVNTARFGVNDQLLITTSDDGSARLWPSVGGTEVSQPIWHRVPVLDARFSYDDQRVLTVSADNTARLWSRPIFSDPVFWWDAPLPIHAATVSRDGELLAVAEEDRLRLLSRHPEKQPTREFMVSLAAKHLLFSPSGRQLALAEAGGRVLLLDVGKAGSQPDGRLLSSDDLPANPAAQPPGGMPVSPAADDPTQEQAVPVVALEFSEDERLLAVSSAGNLRVWSTQVASNRPLVTLGNRGYGVFSFSPDSSRLASGHNPDGMRLYETRSWQPVSPPLEHGGSVEQICFSPDGKFFASGGQDCSVRIWSAANGRPVTGWLTVASRVAALSFSPDSETLLVTTQDGSVRIWDAQTGRETGVSLPHQRNVLAAVFSPDGRHIATLEQGEGTRLWDVKTGLRLSHPYYTQQPQGLRFSADGRHLLVQSSWPGLDVWTLPTASPVPPDFLVEMTELLTGERIALDGSRRELIDLEYRNRIKRFQSVFGTNGPASPLEGYRVGQPAPGTSRSPNKLLRRW